MTDQEIELLTITTICSSLETILKKCFGPNGLSVMLTTASGTLLITGSGTVILQSLQLSHPIGRVLTDSIITHCQHTGDNCKTFVFMLCRILRRLCRELPKNGNRMGVVCALAHLKHTVLPALVCRSFIGESMTVCCTQDNLEQVRCACSDMFSTTLQGRFNRPTAKHLADVLVGMIFTEFDVADIPAVIEEYIRHFKEVHIEVTGSAIQSTHFIEGVVVQRDFKVHVPQAMDHGVRFMLAAFDVLDSSTSTSSDDIPSVIRVKSTDHLSNTFEWKLKHVEGFIQLLSSRDVNLLLCAGVVSDILAFRCHHAGISVVHAVDEDDMKRLALAFNVHIIYGWSELLSSSVIGNADSCKPMLLGTHRWVLLSPPAVTVRRCTRPLSRQLIVCAPTAGVCSQVASALRACLKCSRMLFDMSVLCDGAGLMWSVPCTEHSHLTKETGNMDTYDIPAEVHTTFDSRTTTGNSHSSRTHPHCAFIPAGGTFETTLYKALQQYKEQCNNTTLSHAADLLQHGLQSVSGHLAQNSHTPSAARPLVAAAMAMNHTQQDGVSSSVIEPLASKVVLLHDLLSLLQQLLRVDKLVSVRRLCPQNDSQSDSEDSL